MLYNRCTFCPVFFALSTTEEASHSWGETFGDQKRHGLVCGKLLEKPRSCPRHSNGSCLSFLSLSLRVPASVDRDCILGQALAHLTYIFVIGLNAFMHTFFFLFLGGSELTWVSWCFRPKYSKSVWKSASILTEWERLPPQRFSK